MSNWWEIQQTGGGEPPLGVRAIAYYRHSAQDRQENSIPIQQDQVREWAAKNGVHIIHEFADAGKSGLNVEGRPAFTEMMEEWVKNALTSTTSSAWMSRAGDDSKISICRNSFPA